MNYALCKGLYFTDEAGTAFIEHKNDGFSALGKMLDHIQLIARQGKVIDVAGSLSIGILAYEGYQHIRAADFVESAVAVQNEQLRHMAVTVEIIGVILQHFAELDVLLSELVHYGFVETAVFADFATYLVCGLALPSI